MIDFASVSTTGRRFSSADIDRFWSKVDASGECWIWKGRIGTAGYGEFNIGRGKYAMGHRFAYVLLSGPIPAGLELDHLCRTPSCVNPAHLEPVTMIENQRRGKHGVLRSSCPKGHPATPENTILRRGHGRRYRVCRPCKQAADRKVAATPA